MFVFVVNRLDAAMERERLLALEKEKAKEEAKKRYVFWKKKCNCGISVSETLRCKVKQFCAFKIILK